MRLPSLKDKRDSSVLSIFNDKQDSSEAAVEDTEKDDSDTDNESIISRK